MFLYGVFWLFKYIFVHDVVQNFLNPIMPVINKISLPGKIGIGLLFCLTLIALNLKRLKKRFVDKNSFYAKSFVSFLDQEKIGLALVFILIFRTGESLLFSMSRPFFMDIGVTISQIGIISGTFGTIATVLGGIIGGFWIAKKGLDKTIWPIMLAQNFTNLVYAALAYKYYYIVGHTDLGQANIYLSGLVILIDNFASGMGSAFFTVYLMRACKIEYKTSHFAIVTGLMTVSSTFAGVLSGFLASSLGYPMFFLISFFASIPSMALIFFIPFIDNNGSRRL
jgi:PAT family beta-lactamase induction signal transducer AmpG